MNSTRQLQDLGQGLWLDNITREMLDNGTLRDYIANFSIAALTSNPTIFDEAIGGTTVYDDGIGEKVMSGSTRRFSATRGIYAVFSNRRRSSLTPHSHERVLTPTHNPPRKDHGNADPRSSSQDARLVARGELPLGRADLSARQSVT